MAAKPNVVAEPFRQGVAGPDQLEARIAKAANPRLIAVDKAKIALGLAEAAHSQAVEAHEILMASDPEGAETLIPAIKSHEAAVARAEIVWAKTFAACTDLYPPPTQAIEDAERALDLADAEIARRSAAKK